MKTLCKKLVWMQGGGMVKPGSKPKHEHIAGPRQSLYIMTMKLELLNS